MKKPAYLFFTAVLLAGTCAPHGTGADDFWQGFRDRQRAELAELPKPPVPPEGDGSAIDRFLAAHWWKKQVAPPAVVDDRTFARRVYFDVVGLPPTVEQLERFLRDSNPNKRQNLVDALLAGKQGYAEH
jgi:hypothetical protein